LFELSFGSDLQDQAFTAEAILLHGEAGVGKFFIWLHSYHCQPHILLLGKSKALDILADEYSLKVGKTIVVTNSG
jgi:hypothetical protein